MTEKTGALFRWAIISSYDTAKASINWEKAKYPLISHLQHLWNRDNVRIIFSDLPAILMEYRLDMGDEAQLQEDTFEAEHLAMSMREDAARWIKAFKYTAEPVGVWNE